MMASSDFQLSKRPVPLIAPRIVSIEDCSHGDRPCPTMPYSCQSCGKRKVRCDKLSPRCSSCRRGKIECFYQAPLPRRRKRNPTPDVNEKLIQYETILRQHGLLPEDTDELPPIGKKSLTDPTSLPFNELEVSTGKLLAGEGKSIYIDSNLWRDLGDDAILGISEDEDEGLVATGVVEATMPDPLTEALMSSMAPQQNLLQYHPTHAEALLLWATHIENVEPICKILHIPSVNILVNTKLPGNVSKADECLLFSIYHFSVFSMTDDECMTNFGESRATLMQRYHFATRQALINASFLKTTEMSVLQALVLFLLPCRHFYDPHTYWILTGVAIRISQRMGLHQDGEKLGLPPFEVQMRRRLFYQLIPLDGVASQLSGTGIAIPSESWDTKKPLNLNDVQIWPGMTEMPEAQNEATEMIFCLARACVGKCFVMAGKFLYGASSSKSKNHSEIKLLIDRAESEVEDKYIRYCDIVNPLHFLTMIFARSAITAMRLRVLLPKTKNQVVTVTERRELFQLSQKIMDMDAAAYTNSNLKRYLWHMGPFFVWGSWDSLIFVLNSLCTIDFFSSADVELAWARLEQTYSNHSELINSRRALQTAVRRLTLKAWDNNPSSGNAPTPSFITTLRTLREAKDHKRTTSTGNPELDINNQDNTQDSTVALKDPFPVNEMKDTFGQGNFYSYSSFDDANDFDFDTVDWMYWDQLIRNDQKEDAE